MRKEMITDSRSKKVRVWVECIDQKTKERVNKTIKTLPFEEDFGQKCIIKEIPHGTLEDSKSQIAIALPDLNINPMISQQSLKLSKSRNDSLGQLNSAI